MTSRKREQLLSTAVDLFYREGYHATGIDRILAESGVAKMTLYKHFRSKDELIMAALEVRRQRTAERMLEAEARLQPRAVILAVFDGLQAVPSSMPPPSSMSARIRSTARRPSKRPSSKPTSSASWSAWACVRRHCLRGSCNT